MSNNATKPSVSAEEALHRLQQGNEKYMNASVGSGDISPAIRKETCENGQYPYAIVVTCSDSRVIPENIFSTGIGELFVIRVAGNVINDFQLGSIEYAAAHLGAKLVAVIGHTHCGAVGAAISNSKEGYIKSIAQEIKLGIGDEKDDYKACCLNVRHGMKKVNDSLSLPDVKVVGAVYHIDDGHVEFIDK